MLIASDPASGRMMVLAPIKGSPAEQAGIQPGDEVGAPPVSRSPPDACNHRGHACCSQVFVPSACSHAFWCCLI